MEFWLRFVLGVAFEIGGWVELMVGGLGDFGFGCLMLLVFGVL